MNPELRRIGGGSYFNSGCEVDPTSTEGCQLPAACKVRVDIARVRQRVRVKWLGEGEAQSQDLYFSIISHLPQNR